MADGTLNKPMALPSSNSVSNVRHDSTAFLPEFIIALLLVKSKPRELSTRGTAPTWLPCPINNSKYF